MKVNMKHNQKSDKSAQKRKLDVEKTIPTGRRIIIEGDEFFELRVNGKSKWIPAEPDVVYGRTGEWRGWSDFLGIDVADDAGGEPSLIPEPAKAPLSVDRPKKAVLDV